jgi:hypothetical protein
MEPTLVYGVDQEVTRSVKTDPFRSLAVATNWRVSPSTMVGFGGTMLTLAIGVGTKITVVSLLPSTLATIFVRNEPTP